MLFEGGTQKYTEIRRKEGDADVLLKEIIQELFQKCKFFYQEIIPQARCSRLFSVFRNKKVVPSCLRCLL